MPCASIQPIDDYRWAKGDTRMSEVREAVRTRYANVAKQLVVVHQPGSGPVGCCQADGPDCGCSGSYSAEALQEIGLTESVSLGCGNPTMLAELKPGETVLDLGSGAGLDVLLSARRVAPGGRAYGLGDPRHREQAGSGRQGRQRLHQGPKTADVAVDQPTGSSTASTSKSLSGSGRPRSCRRPGSRKVTPCGREASTASRVGSDITIWPPSADAQTRAAVLTARPTYPVSVSVGRPVCRPILIRTWAPSAQTCERAAR